MSMPTLPRSDPSARRFGPNPAPQPVTTTRPSRRSAGKRVWVTIGLGLVCAAFAARDLGVARTDSITPDEATHLVHCLHYWMTGDDLRMWELGAPRLPHIVYAGASYLGLRSGGLLPDRGGDLRVKLTRLVRSGLSRALMPARVLAIGSGLSLVMLVFWAVARSRGAVAGLVAAALLSMVPEVLAHSAIAGSDMPFAAAAFLSLILMARYAERPTAGRWVVVALAIGLAWAVRHTALLLLLLAAGVHVGMSLRRPRPAGLLPLAECLLGSVGASVALGLIAYLVLWAGDGFGTVTLAEASESITRLDVPRQVGPMDLSNLPIPSSLLSMLKQVSHQGRGHEAYFCGEVRQQGWLLYFPVALLLKTPVGLLILMVLAAARFRPRDSFEILCLACLALLWMTLLRSKVNIGLRYALLTYPLAIPFVSRLFEPGAIRDRVWGPIALVALLWFGTASAVSHPRYLSSFNELGGGPRQGWLYLADSNIDWGQDFDALAATLKRLGINDVTTDLISERRLIEPGLCAIPFPIRELQVPAVTPPNRRLYDSEGTYLPVFTRYFAVGVTRLFGLYSRNDLSWLRTRRVVTRVGDSIFVFDMDRPADAPFDP
jgi:hypothetical protein